MKKTVFTTALILGLQLSLTAEAQKSETISLRIANFVRPLVEKWTSEYQKTHQDVVFQIVSGKQQDSENSISLTTDDDAVLFARFAVLPVTTRGSKAEQLASSQRLNARKLKSLFFVDEFTDEDQKEGKLEKSLHIFTGNSQLSASKLYATHFHQETADYKGKKISGDDTFLFQAISRDSLGVTVNSLSNIFDLQSGQLRQTLSLLPLDIDKQARQVLSEGNLQEVIQLLETEQYSEIPIGSIGLSYNHSNPVLSDFVSWVLTDGTQYVHQYGLLSLSQKELDVQQHRAEQKELAQK